MDVIKNLLKYKLSINANDLGFQLPKIETKGLKLSEKTKVLLVGQFINQVSKQEADTLDTILNIRYDGIYISTYGYYLFNIIKKVDITSKTTDHPILVKIRIAYNRGFQIFKVLNIFTLIINKENYYSININTFINNLKCYITFLILYHYIDFFRNHFGMQKISYNKSNLENYTLYPFWVVEQTKGKYLILNDLDSKNKDNTSTREKKLTSSLDELKPEITSRPILDNTQTQFKKTIVDRRQYSLATKESIQPRRSRLQNNNEEQEEIYCGSTNNNYKFFQQSKDIILENLKSFKTIPKNSDNIFIYGWVGEYNLFKLGFYNESICPHNYPLRTTKLSSIKQDLNNTLLFSLKYLLNSSEFKLPDVINELNVNDILSKITKEFEINIIIIYNDNRDYSYYINNIQNKYYFIYHLYKQQVYEPIIFLNNSNYLKYIGNEDQLIFNLNISGSKSDFDSDGKDDWMYDWSDVLEQDESPKSATVADETGADADTVIVAADAETDSKSVLDSKIVSPILKNISVDDSDYVHYNILDINSSLPIIIINDKQYLLGNLYNNFRNIYQFEFPFRIYGRINQMEKKEDQYSIKLQWTSDYNKDIIQLGSGRNKLNLFQLLNKS